METKIALLVIYFLFGCKAQTNQQKIDQDFQTVIDTLASDTFYNLNFIDSDKYVIEWGTSSFKNVSKDTFDVLGSGNLGLSESNSKYVVLNQPCGSGCALYVILPLISNKKELIFWNVVYHNLNEEFIITTLDPGLGKFAISKYGTNTEQEIFLNDLCPAADKSMCIDSIFVNGKELYFQYQGSNWKENKPDPRFYKVKF